MESHEDHEPYEGEMKTIILVFFKLYQDLPRRDLAVISQFDEEGKNKLQCISRPFNMKNSPWFLLINSIIILTVAGLAKTPSHVVQVIYCLLKV